MLKNVLTLVKQLVTLFRNILSKTAILPDVNMFNHNHINIIYNTEQILFLVTNKLPVVNPHIKMQHHERQG